MEKWHCDIFHYQPPFRIKRVVKIKPSVLKITLKAFIIIVLGICQVQLLLLAVVLSVILVPMDLDVTTKAVVLGSCFLIVSTLSHNVIILRVYCK